MGVYLAFNKRNAQPEFTVAASISGTAEVGQTLTCSYAVAKARPQNVTVRWYRHSADDGSDPDGELIGTGLTHQVAAGSVLFYLRCAVDATNPAGTTTSYSAYTAQVPAVDEVVPPTDITLSQTSISDAAAVGAVVATISSDGDGPLTYTKTADPDSKFTVSGNQLLLAVAVDNGVAASHSVTLRATNSAGYVDETFTISVLDSAGDFAVSPVLSMDQGARRYDSGTSQYLFDWNAGEYVQVDFEVTAGAPTVQWFYFTNPADIDGTKVNISAGAVAPNALLPVSAPNAYQAAYFMDVATFGGANANTRYIGCDVTIGSTTERATRTTSAIGGILGTPISAATFGSGAYWLPAANTQYYLTEDLTCDRSGFMFSKVGQTLNLNGHTLTYSNAPVLTLTNHSFEIGSGTTAEGWDFSNAGSTGAQIHAPADAEEAYSLSQLVDGAKSLKFTNTTASGYVESTSTVSVSAGKTHLVSVHGTYGGYDVSNPGVVMYVEVRDSADDSLLTRAEYSGTQSRYMWQFVSSFAVGGSDRDIYVRLGIEGHASATQPVYFDYVTIEQTGMCAAYAGYWVSSMNSDFATTQGALTPGGDEPCIKNGNIVQGQPHYKGHAIDIFNPWPNWQRALTSRVSVTVSGNSAHAIRQRESNSGRRHTVQHSTFTSNARFVSNRDAFDGAIIINLRGPVIRYNEFRNGPHAGVFVNPTTFGDGYPIGSTIYGNRFYMKDRVSNAFAIAGGRAATVYDNQVFNGQGEYHGRGIAVEAGYSADKKTLIHHNYVEVQQVGSRQEYGNQTPPGNFAGAYAIQVESEAGGIDGYVEIYGNTLKAYATEQQAFAVRLNMGEFTPLTGVKIYNNDIHVIAAGGYGRGAAFKVLNINSGVEIYDNNVYTNDALINLDGPSDITMTGMYLDAQNTLSGATPVTDTMYWPPWSPATSYTAYYGDASSSTNAVQRSADITDDDPDAGTQLWQNQNSHTSGASFTSAEAAAHWALIECAVICTGTTYAGTASEDYIDNRAATNRIATSFS